MILELLVLLIIIVGFIARKIFIGPAPSNFVYGSSPKQIREIMLGPKSENTHQESSPFGEKMARLLRKEGAT